MSALSSQPRAIGSRFIPWHEHCGIFPQDEVCRMADLSLGEKLLYGVLVRFSGKDGRCFPSREKLAEELAISVRQVGRLISGLENAGLIEHERGREGRSNRYYFLWHERFQSINPTDSVPRTPQYHDSLDQVGGSDMSESRGQGRPTNHSSNYTKNYTKNYTSGNSGAEEARHQLQVLFGNIATRFRDSHLVMSDQMGPHFRTAVLEKLGGHSIKEFAAFISGRFKAGRSPGGPDGPQKWRDFILWAVDFVREKQGLPPVAWDPNWEPDSGRITPRLMEEIVREFPRPQPNSPASRPLSPYLAADEPW